MEAFADNVATFCADAIQKESFIETFGSAKRITFELYQPEEGDYNYSRTRSDNGSLVMGCPLSKFGTNVQTIGNDLSKTCSGDSGGLSVAARKNIKDQEPNRKKFLTKIQKTCGLEFDVDIDWIVASENSKARGYEDRAGEVFYSWYLEALATSIESFCSDPIQKEAFLETFGEKKTIAFNLVKSPLDDEHPHRYSYSWVANKDGVLELNIPTERLASNVSTAGDNFSKACSGDSAISVATRKNIKDYEREFKKHMTRINKATGIEYELEIDWVPFAAAAKSRGYEDRVGEAIYSWYLEALANSLETLCKDDMSKEAVVESCERKTIAFKLIEQSELEGYSKCTFDDGVLTVSLSTERFASNVGACGNDIESRL